MVVMAAVYAQWVSVSGGLGGQQTYTENVADVATSHTAVCDGIDITNESHRSCEENALPAAATVAAGTGRVDSSQTYFPPTLYPTATPTLAPPPTPVAQAASVSGQLTEAEVIAVLAEAGWEDALIPEALAVFCGINNRSGFPRGESGCNPGAVGDSGNSLGLAQLNGDTWAPYCGVPRAALMDALTNLRCARKVYQYDIDRAYGAWKQWSVKP